jgi:hypothetical protein
VKQKSGTLNIHNIILKKTVIYINKDALNDFPGLRLYLYAQCHPGAKTAIGGFCSFKE